MIEKIELKKTDSTKNLNRVPVKKWRKWNVLARKTFNDLYGAMIDSPWAFSHPKQDKIPQRRWKTTAWNAAWMAAESVTEGSR